MPACGTRPGQSPSNVVWAATNDDRVLVSANAGATWDLVLENVSGWPRVTRQIGGPLPDVPVNTVAVHVAGRQRWIFAGTDVGVFVTEDFGVTWEPYGTLPRAPVNDLVVDVRHGRLVASTLGRGAWSVALPRP